jgi:hypothetical protein
MGLTATELLDLDQDAQMAHAISYLQANPNQSIRQIARIFNLPRISAWFSFSILALINIGEYWRYL